MVQREKVHALMSTIQNAQAIGKTGDPFWVDVIQAYETIFTQPNLRLRVERGDKAADVYVASDGCVVIVISSLSGDEMSTTKIQTHGGISDKSGSGKERD